MASLRQDIPINAPAAAVWSALRDFGAVHQRIAPGFVTDCTLDGDARTVTFFNGMVARELLVDSDDNAQRLVYAIVDGRAKHYNASAQVFAEGDGCRVVWIIDLLPHELAAAIGPLQARGAKVMKQTLERS